jgi:hypothetical protein
MSIDRHDCSPFDLLNEHVFLEGMRVEENSTKVAMSNFHVRGHVSKGK